MKFLRYVIYSNPINKGDKDNKSIKTNLIKI